MIRIEYVPGRSRGEGRLSEAAVKRAAGVVSKALKLGEPLTVSVALVDAPTMRRLNKTYGGKDAVTDVLAFQYDEPAEGSEQSRRGAFGEVVICPSRAREQAREAGRSLKEEMIELLVHGLLHVFGYDHIKPKDAHVMLPLQKHIVTKLL